MSAYKNLNKSDVIVVPYIANKQWNIASASLSSYNIEIFTGKNITSSLFEPNNLSTFPTTSNGEYQNLVYKLIEQLYYSNYIHRPRITGSLFTSGTSSFDNFDTTTGASGSGITNIKYFPTASNSQITILSIPQNIYGNKILPKTFNISGSGYLLRDDGEGNLYDILTTTSSYVGNIIYPHGLIILTTGSYINNLTSSFNLSFKNDYTIYEMIIKCNVLEDDFGYTLNPSIMTNSSGSLRGFATSSYFVPYVTTIGLYNETNELLAIGKMSQPVPLSSNTDTNFLLRMDI